MEIRLADRELEVMSILWDRGDATVAEVQDHLDDDLAYTTILTVLRTLEEKGFVGHRPDGRAHRYHALIERQRVEASAVRRLVARMFRDSPELLLTRLVADRALSKTELEELRRLVDERLEEEE